MAKRKQAPGDPTLAVAYLRVSTDDQRNGPDVQRADIERWASRHGVTVAGWFEDKDISGGDGLTEDLALDLGQRPALVAAMAALSERRAGLMLVQCRDRWARDIVLAAMLDRVVSKAGAQVVSAIGAGSDPRRAGDDDSDEDMKVFEDWQAQRERRKIRRRTKMALAIKKARGERVGTLPYGFQLAADGVKLEPRADEQAVIARVAELQAAGVKQAEIVRALESAGVVGRTGKPLSQPQVHRLLTRGGAASAPTVAA